jgi:hypothetical protein
MNRRSGIDRRVGNLGRNLGLITFRPGSWAWAATMKNPRAQRSESGGFLKIG